MPVFLVERNFAEQLQVTPEGAASINKVNAEIGVQWLISFLSVDKKKTYCLYEASSAEAIRFTVEQLPQMMQRGAVMEVGDDRFEFPRIRALYDSESYPLARDGDDER